MIKARNSNYTRRPSAARAAFGRLVTLGAALVVALAVLIALARSSMAQTYVCPPAPEGVYGLPGAPRFADTPAPDSFAPALDDPRWNGNFRNDFAASTSTEAGVRMIRDGNFLYVSFEAVVDPDGAVANSDTVYLGFSKDGTTAQMVKIVMTVGPPLTDSTNISTITWWQTTDGGATPWAQQPAIPPLPWVSNIRAWSGAGADNGDAWAINAKIDLTQVLGGLTSNFYMWYEINVETPAGAVPYDWPPGDTLGFSGTQALLQVKSGGTVVWGTADPTVATNCPTGISIDPMHIGTTPITAGIPGTTVYSGTGLSPNTFVALMDNGGATIPNGSVKARFRIANWGSQIGVGGTWQDIVPPGDAGGPGTRTNAGNEIDFHCVNPPDVSDAPCFQLPAGAPTDQCLLVELSQANGSGMQFLSDSARRNMDFVTASRFERSAELSVKGLTPLAGSSGTRDAYIYVRSLHMPPVTDGNPPIVVPPPVPPVPPVPQRPRSRAGIKAPAVQLPALGGGAPRTDAGETADAGPPPRYRLTTYQRYASVMPAYEVHVYHDTGRTRFEDGATRKLLEPQAPFGYFVTHSGDLRGWKHSLKGEGFDLEEIAPNFYHAKIPDNGSVHVRTAITAIEPGGEGSPDAGAAADAGGGGGGGGGGGCDHPCGCKVAGSKIGNREGWLVALGIAALGSRRRSRRRRR